MKKTLNTRFFSPLEVDTNINAEGRSHAGKMAVDLHLASVNGAPKCSKFDSEKENLDPVLRFYYSLFPHSVMILFLLYSFRELLMYEGRTQTTSLEAGNEPGLEEAGLRSYTRCSSYYLLKNLILFQYFTSEVLLHSSEKADKFPL